MRKMATSPDDVFYTCPDQSSRAIRMFSLVRQLLEYIKWCYTRPFARTIFIKATVLDQCCNRKQCCSNVVTLCSAEYRGCQSSRVTLALATKLDNERLNEVGRLCSNSRQNCLLPYYLLACEKAPHFRRTKRTTRECENERRSREGSRKTSFPRLSLPRRLWRAAHAWHLATPPNGKVARRLSYLSLHITCFLRHRLLSCLREHLHAQLQTV